MSALNDKINSYAIEKGIRFNQAYSLPPTETGSVAQSTSANWTLTGISPVYESNVGPIHGDGSWKFVTTGGNACRLRTTQSTFLSTISDQDYSIGFWVRVNILPPDDTLALPIHSFNPFASTGYLVSVYGPNNAGKSYFDFTGNMPYADNQVEVITGTWYYIAIRSSSTVIEYYINGQLVYSDTNTSVTGSGTNVNFGSVNQGYDGSINISNYYMAPFSTINGTAIAEIWNVGSGASVVAEPMTANAYISDAFFNPNPYIQAEMMEANATSGNHIYYVSPSYYAKVKSKNPIFYIGNGSTTGSSIINNGSGSFGTPTVGASINTNTLPAAPMNLINEGVCWKPAATVGASTAAILYNNSTAWDTLKTLIKSNTYSIEFWANPSSNWNTTSGSSRTFFEFVGTSNNSISFYRASTSSGQYSTFQIKDNNVNYNLVVNHANNTNTWNHFVITVAPNSTNPSTQVDIKVYINSFLTASTTISKPTWTTIDASTVSNISWNMVYTGLSNWDEAAIYPTALTVSDVIDNYSFVLNQSPDRTVSATTLVGSAQMSDAVISISIFKNIAATPITASSQMVDPTVSAQFNAGGMFDSVTATALMTNIIFAGDPDVRIYATPITAEADMLTATKRNTVYSDYIKALGPYRYHSLDNIDNWILGYPADNTNEGSDTAYTLSMFNVGLGTHSLVEDVINNYSVHSELNYQTNNYQRSLVIQESVYNDMWGTDLPSNGTGWTMGFWMREHESYTYNNGLIVLANINGSSTGDHIILYYDAGRIFIELNDGGTKATYETSPVTLFNDLRHNIVITFGKVASNQHELRVYVDGVNKLITDVGALHPQIIPSTTVSSPNSSNYNIVSLGGMITTYSNTLFNTVPQNLNAYFDEFFWFKSSLTPTQITNQYNALPVIVSTSTTASPMTANATNVTATTKLGIGILPSLFIAEAEFVNPTLQVDFDRTVSTSPMLASCQLPMPIFRNDNAVLADPFQAQSEFVMPIVASTIPAQPMIATIKLANNNITGIKVNGYLPYIVLSPWATYLRATETRTILPMREVV